jgi:hypothetical protein
MTTNQIDFEGLRDLVGELESATDAFHLAEENADTQKMKRNLRRGMRFAKQLADWATEIKDTLEGSYEEAEELEELRAECDDEPHSNFADDILADSRGLKRD